LKGEPAQEGVEGPPSLLLKSEGKLAQGSGGCNRFTGSYELEGDSLKFGPIASTRMFCEEVMDQEQAYLQVLTETTGYKVSGNSLELYKGDELLARLTLDKLK
jgi:heat shock protein HslJ